MKITKIRHWLKSFKHACFGAFDTLYALYLCSYAFLDFPLKLSAFKGACIISAFAKKESADG